jgi:trigger factor
MLAGIDDAVRGLSAGEDADFTSQLVGGDLAGQDVDVNVKVSAVKEQDLPEVDDDFAQTASEFDTVGELRDDIRTRLERGKRLEQAAAARDAVLEKLLEAAEVPLPDALVQQEITARKQDIEQQLMYAGMTLQTYLDEEKKTVDEFEADIEKQVRDGMVAQFLLDEIAKAEELGVDQNELTQHLMRRAQQSGQNPDEFVKHMVEHNHIPEMVGEVVRGKALALIVEGATVTDESGHVVDLKHLQPDGSIAEPTAEDAVGTGTDEPAAEAPDTQESAGA